MIYKFKVWVWSPLKTEIHLSAKDDDEACKIFQALDLNNFPAGKFKELEVNSNN